MRLLLALVLALFAAAPASASAGAWRWPVRGPVISPFRYDAARPFRAGQRRGIDIEAPAGTPVRAACAGRVTFAGTAGTSGRTVAVACGALGASYLHLGSLAVRRGAGVLAGERLGTVGSSGRRREPGPHLSFGVRVLARRWTYLDPLRLLGDVRGPAPPVGPVPAGRRLPPLGPVPRPVPVPRPRNVPVLRSRPARVPVLRPVQVLAPARTSAPLGVWWVPMGLALIATAGGAAVARAAARRGGALRPTAAPDSPRRAEARAR